MDAERRDTTTRATTGRDRWILLLFVLVALVPVAGAAVRLHHAGWVPEGDDAMIARRTMAVFSDHPPITGQPSTAGGLFTRDGSTAKAATIEASHPGPLEYYALALPYRLSGWSPDGLLLAVALVDGAAVTATVWLAWRQMGALGALGGALAVLFVAAHLGSWNLGRPLNAGIAVLPLLAGLVGTWAVLDRDRVAIVPTVVALSFVVQAHLGAAPLAAAALVVAIAAEARAWWLGRRATTEPAAGEEPDGEGDLAGRRSRPWVPRAAAGVALALCWILVVGQQATGHPGNVTRLLEVARLRVDRAGPAFGLAAVFDQVVQPAWPGGPTIARISIIGPIASGPALAKGVLLAVVLGAAISWAQRSGRVSVVRLLAVAAGAVLVPIGVLSRGPDEVRLGPSYQLTSLLAVGGVVVLGLTVVAVELVGPRLRGLAPPTVRTGAAVALAAVAALGVATFGGPTYAEDASRTRAIADGIRHAVPKGRYRLQASGSWAYLSTLDAVSVELLRHGYDVRIVRLGGIPDEPVRRNTDVVAPTIILDSTDVPRTDGRLLVRRPPLSADPTWASQLLAAVSRPDVTVRRVGDASGASPCAQGALGLAGSARRPLERRHLVRAILRCSQTDRRAVASRLRWSGLERFWVDVLGSNMPGPYPHTGLAAYLVPVPAPHRP